MDKTSDRKYQYTYDSLGRLIYQTGKNTSDSQNRTSSSYKYDISDNLTEITNTAGKESVTAKYYYDNINRPTKSYFNGAAAHNYTYDKLGRLTNAAVTLTDTTVNHRFTYHSAAARNTGDSTQYQTTQVKTETIGGRAYNYTYDNVGNITVIKERKTSDGDYAVKVSYI